MARPLASAASLLFVAAISLSLVQSGLTLRCWVCSSNSDGLCRDPFNGTRTGRTDCNQQRTHGNTDYAYCQKLVTSIDGGEPKVVRKCAFSREPLQAGACVDPPRDTEHLTLQYCATCDSDYCNGASAPGSAAAAAAAALSASWIVARFLS